MTVSDDQPYEDNNQETTLSNDASDGSIVTRKTAAFAKVGKAYISSFASISATVTNSFLVIATE